MPAKQTKVQSCSYDYLCSSLNHNIDNNDFDSGVLNKTYLKAGGTKSNYTCTREMANEILRHNQFHFNKNTLQISIYIELFTNNTYL